MSVTNVKTVRIMTELYAKYTNIVHYLYKVEVVELF